MLLPILGDSRAPSDGFFGTVGAAWETGLSKIGSDILPNWVQSQVNRQSSDQLAKATYDAETSAPRIEGQTVDHFEGTPGSGIQKAWLDLKTGNITAGPLIIMGVVLVGIVVVLKKM